MLWVVRLHFKCSRINAILYVGYNNVIWKDEENLQRWGKLIEMIKYKAEWYGREFVQISQWFPSSKKCHVCGEINHDLSRDEREWECPHCHAVHQRDVNAAKNILDEGIRATGSMVLSLVDFIPNGENKFIYKYELKCFVDTADMA